jgi:serine/threonine-protein kinase
MEMVCIPAGEFLMGSADDPRASLNEKPQHTVPLEAYWIDRTEVTVTNFRAFVEASSYQTTAEYKGVAQAYVESAGGWSEVQGASWQHPFGPQSSAEDNHPVTQVSWYDADAYCRWVALAHRAGKRRGTDGRIYPWGDEFDGTFLNFKDASFDGDMNFNDGFRFTAPVGSYPQGASPYGALDMAGNVWEWTADWYQGGYNQLPAQNPTGPARVLRGGSWNHEQAGMRAAYRLESSPSTLVDNFGFRCVVPAEGE